MGRWAGGRKRDLRKAGLRHWDDASVLFHAGRCAGAMYLAGYHAECTLKVALMDVAGVQDIADLEAWLLRDGRKLARTEFHNLERLSQHHPGVQRLLTWPGDGRAPEVLAARRVCNKWKTAWRYENRTDDAETADRFLRSVDLYVKYLVNSL